MAQTRMDYVEHMKWEHFKELSRTNEKIATHRQFLELTREVIQRLPAVERQAPSEDLVEMEAVVDSPDPWTSHELVQPAIKKPEGSGWQPFWKGWMLFSATLTTRRLQLDGGVSVWLEAASCIQTIALPYPYQHRVSDHRHRWLRYTGRSRP